MTSESPSMRGNTPPPLSDELAGRASILAMGVRNAMEGTIHGGELGEVSLSDHQMAILNPIIRNAIATGLHAEQHYFTDSPARRYIQFQQLLVPPYSERPHLLDEYTDLWSNSAGRSDNPGFSCRHCGRTVVDIGTQEKPRWTHVSAQGPLIVGCRAASFTVADGWNDSIARSWKAAPS